MESANKISDASLYTDFSGLQKLRSTVSSGGNTAEVREANKEVAKQFESLFLQMMLKSMRDATAAGDTTESDQTRFYQEMFDKQIALDLANNENGGGLGIAAMLERDMGVRPPNSSTDQSDVGSDTGSDAAMNNVELIRAQVNRSSSAIQPGSNSTKI